MYRKFINFSVFVCNYLYICDGKRRRLVCVKKPFDLVTDFWFGYRLLIWFSDPVKILEKARGISWFCAFLYILYKNCSSTWTENPRNFFRKSAILSKCWLTPSPLLDGSTIVPHGSQTLKTTKRLRSFVHNLVYSDSTNLKRNIYENAAYFFVNLYAGFYCVISSKNYCICQLLSYKNNSNRE